MDEPPMARTTEDRWVTTRVGESGYRADASVRHHAFALDEPREVGGTDTAPTPYEYLLSALGGCMAITMRMYADRKGWPLTGIEVQLRSARQHMADCASCETEDVGIGRLERRIILHGALDDEQRRRVLAVGDRCPMKQTLSRGLVVTDLAPA